MLIEEKPLQQWMDHFYGYGSWHAKYWFISHEENGGDVPEEVAEKVNYFYKLPVSTQPVLCDMRDLYRNISVRPDHPKAKLFANLFEYRFGDNAVQDTVWKNLIAFQYGYRNEPLPDLPEYQKYIFASSRGSNEALIRLFPLPGPSSHAWYYSWLELPQLSFLKSRTLYQDHVYQQRIQTILSNIIEHKPQVILMYGMKNIQELKKSIQQFFTGVKFRMIKVVEQQIPQHHRADIDGTTILITTQIPALKHQRIETGFDWEEFGKRVRL